MLFPVVCLHKYRRISLDIRDAIVIHSKYKNRDKYVNNMFKKIFDNIQLMLF